jgi:hypothetical protein
VLRLLVGVRFQVSFTPLVGVLFTFPSRYLCTIGRRGVFRLGGWSPHVQTGFHVPRPTQGSPRAFRLRGSHPLRPTFPDPSARPTATTGLVRFRSPLLAESRLMSVPPGTEMFQFPGFASWAYGFSPGSPKGRGFPIRTSADQRSLASPRGFSQRATSFIASRRQGIHRTPLSCSGQNKRPATQQQPTNQPTPLKQNQTPPPPTPTPAAARATNNGRTNDRTDGAIHHTTHPIPIQL